MRGGITDAETFLWMRTAGTQHPTNRATKTPSIPFIHKFTTTKSIHRFPNGYPPLSPRHMRERNCTIGRFCPQFGLGVAFYQLLHIVPKPVISGYQIIVGTAHHRKHANNREKTTQWINPSQFCIFHCSTSARKNANKWYDIYETKKHPYGSHHTDAFFIHDVSNLSDHRYSPIRRHILRPFRQDFFSCVLRERAI